MKDERLKTKIDDTILSWIQNHTKLPIDGKAHHALVSAVSEILDTELNTIEKALGLTECSERPRIAAIVSEIKFLQHQSERMEDQEEAHRDAQEGYHTAMEIAGF